MKLSLERVLLALLTVAVTALLLREFQFNVQLEHVVSLVMIGVAVWLVYGGYRAYKGASGDWKKRLFASFSYSGTIVATRAQYAVGLLLTFSESIASLLNEPTIASALQQYASPKLSGGLLIGSAVITEWARRRKASTDPLGPIADPVVPEDRRPPATPVTDGLYIPAGITGATGA